MLDGCDSGIKAKEKIAEYFLDYTTSVKDYAEGVGWNQRWVFSRCNVTYIFYVFGY
jgi:hypothetical protein